MQYWNEVQKKNVIFMSHFRDSHQYLSTKSTAGHETTRITFGGNQIRNTDSWSEAYTLVNGIQLASTNEINTLFVL